MRLGKVILVLFLENLEQKISNIELMYRGMLHWYNAGFRHSVTMRELLVRHPQEQLSRRDRLALNLTQYDKVNK
jgi:hypothetical protein